ncbi:MAG: coenzyme synthesis protein [Anaerocolumna sp.]|jgi:hypothetical protein|nr:coenzyme synthesis protein [Anaerocolumna sp.]
MKIKHGFLLREIAGLFVVVPVGERVVEFNGLMSLSESGALLWKRLEEETTDEQDLVHILTSNYEVEDMTARADVAEFLSHITEKGLLEV